MLCLGIESSCDETALALVRTSDAAGKGGLARNSELVAEVVRTQADMHALFGGVVPELASREHGRLIGPLYDLLLAQGAIEPESIDIIAFARGPGLLGSLLVGSAFAKVSLQICPREDASKSPNSASRGWVRLWLIPVPIALPCPHSNSYSPPRLAIGYALQSRPS